MNDEKQWRIILTKPGAEKKVCDLLSKKSIEHYCPKNRKSRNISRSGKAGFNPVFERYVFVNMTTMQESVIKQIDGIQHFIFWLGRPATIHLEELEMIKRFTEQHEDVVIEKTSVNISDKATALYYTQPHEAADDKEVSKEYRRLLLPSIGYALVAEIRRPHVEVLNIRKPNYDSQNMLNGSFR
jgi:transcription antitermination factor NusG